MMKGKIIVKADTLLQEMTSDENGTCAVFTLDLPLGKYYVKELKAPAGFVSSDEILNFDASYQGQNTTVVQLKRSKEKSADNGRNHKIRHYYRNRAGGCKPESP